MPLKAPFENVSCARLPLQALAALAEVRAAPGIEVLVSGVWAWVRWPAEDEDVLRRLLPVAGVELYELRGAHWYRHGHHLPSFTVPQTGDYRPLAQVVLPLPLQPLPPPRNGTWERANVQLVADRHRRPATAVECSAAELARWADGVPGARLASLQAACCGPRVLLLGQRLPPLAKATRFWGRSVFIPLGYRPEPALADAALREILGLDGDELAFFTEAALETVPRAAFQPLTRRGVRLAAGADR